MFAAFAAAAWLIYVAVGFRKTTVAMGDYCYEVPNKFFASSPFLENLLGGGGFDESVAELYLRFPAQYVSEKVPGYSEWVDGREGGTRDDVTVIFSALSPENVEYIESGVHDRDLWRAEGQYSDEIFGQKVIWDEDVQLFRVSYARIPGNWTFVELDPRTVEQEMPSSNHVIAGCHSLVGGTDDSYSCLHNTLRGNLSVEHHLSDENFPLYREIDDFIYDEIESWKSGMFIDGECKPM